MGVRKPGELVQLKVRVPEEVRESVEAASQRRGVSISTEVADRLKWSLEREELLPEVLALKFEVGPAGLVMAVADVMDLVGRVETTRLPNRPQQYMPETWVDDGRCREQALLAGMALLAMMRPRYAGLRPDEAVLTLGFVLDFMNDLRTADKWPEKMPKDYSPLADRTEAKRQYPRHRARMQGIRNLLGPNMNQDLRLQNIADLVNAFRSIAQLIEDVQHRNEGLFNRE